MNLILNSLKALVNPLFLIGLLLLPIAYYFGNEYSFFSTTYLILTGLYFFLASIVIFEIRLSQWKRYEDVDCGALPRWIGDLAIPLSWIIAGIMIILNWKLFIIIFTVRFVLKLFPVLEWLGSVLLMPFIIPPKD